MINFGLIDEWEPRGGTLTSWTATPASVARAATAPVHPVPASHQQEEYLRAATRNSSAGFRFSRLCLISFDLEGTLDREAMTATVNAFIRRHDTFLSWFSHTAEDDSITRHVIDPDGIEFAPTTHGHREHAAEIRTHVQDETPGPFHWDCFTFGTIERETGFTIYFAVDHLNSDGVSQALACVDLIALYGNELGGGTNPPAQAGSYIDYCRREREGTAVLTAESPQIARWLSLLADNGGRLPTFPLDLGAGGADYTRSAMTTVRVYDDDASGQRLEDVCRAHGSGVAAGVMAAAALVAHEFTGTERYLGMTPKNTRSTASEFTSVGWFTNLIPVVVDVHADSTFTSIVGPAQESFTAGKTMSEVSLHRVLQLVDDDSGIDIAPGWVVPMVSYIDVRKLPGAQMFDHINGGVFGNRGSSEEVYLWVNRFPDYTVMTLLYPDSDQARDSIKLYVERLLGVFGSIAATGDYRPAAASTTR